MTRYGRGSVSAVAVGLALGSFIKLSPRGFKRSRHVWFGKGGERGGDILVMRIIMLVVYLSHRFVHHVELSVS